MHRPARASLADLIHRARVVRGITPRQLAKYSGVSVHMVNHVEAGRRLIPAWHVRPYAHALGIPVVQILEAIEHDYRHAKQTKGQSE